MAQRRPVLSVMAPRALGGPLRLKLVRPLYLWRRPPWTLDDIRDLHRRLPPSDPRVLRRVLSEVAEQFAAASSTDERIAKATTILRALNELLLGDNDNAIDQLDRFDERAHVVLRDVRPLMGLITEPKPKNERTRRTLTAQVERTIEEIAASLKGGESLAEIVGSQMLWLSSATATEDSIAKVVTKVNTAQKRNDAAAVARAIFRALGVEPSNKSAMVALRNRERAKKT